MRKGSELYNSPFAADLKAWARRMGYTRAEAAEALGDVPISTYDGWCVGRPPALEGTLRRLMAALEAEATRP